MSSDLSLQTQARARLQRAQQALTEVRQAIATHEAALAALRAQLPELEFEEAAMGYIVAGAAPAAAASVRRKLSRPELVGELKLLMRQIPAWEVGELHAALEAAGVDLGANARNYLCGVLSRNKDVHFANLGKGRWGLAGP